MKINVKTDYVLVMNRTGSQAREATVYNVGRRAFDKGDTLQVYRFWITEDGRSDEYMRARVGIARAAFWHNKELMKGNIRSSTQLKILNSYAFSLSIYGYEGWTWNKALHNTINACDKWYYRRFVNVRWKADVEVYKTKQTNLHFLEDTMKRKMKYAGHVLRGSGGLSHHRY
jgi:hypothetical protein